MKIFTYTGEHFSFLEIGINGYLKIRNSMLILNPLKKLQKMPLQKVIAKKLIFLGTLPKKSVFWQALFIGAFFAVFSTDLESA